MNKSLMYCGAILAHCGAMAFAHQRYVCLEASAHHLHFRRGQCKHLGYKGPVLAASSRMPWS